VNAAPVAGGHGPGRWVAAALGVTVAAAVAALVWLWLVVTPWDEPVLPLLVFVPVPAVVWLLISRSGSGRVATVGVWLAVVAVMVATVGLSVSGMVTRARYDAPLDAMTAASLDLLAGVDVPTEACGLAPIIDYGPLGAPVSVCVVTYDIGLSDIGLSDIEPEDSGPAQIGPARVGPAVIPVAMGGSGDTIAVRQVRFTWGSEQAGTNRDLVFEASVAQPPAGRCVRPVRDQWWAWMDNGAGCPKGFVSSSQ
jgi:hypothetical protein